MAIPAALRQDLSDIPILEDSRSLRMRSRDFFWFSPILRETLEDKRADIVVMPRNKADVVRLAVACAKHRVPLTVRGGGTGNYGQAVPLAGGVALDTTKLDQVIWHRSGAGRFVIMAELDAKGVAISNPHTFVLDNAGWKRVDAPQADFKRLAGPYGLMNPGKLEHWQARDMRAIA